MVEVPQKAGGSQPENTAPDQAPALFVSAVRYENPVGKRYGYKDKVVPGKSNSRSPRAVGETHPYLVFRDFVDWRKQLTTEYMLTSGTFESAGEISVVYKGNERPGEASATKNYLTFYQRPGILIIDVDFKDPDEVAGLQLGDGQPYTSHDAALAALSKILPEADDCAHLIGWSTSSNLFKDKTQVKGTGGIRIYIPITDASRIPHILDIIHKRCWLYGIGWAFVDKAGGFQERSFVDKALARPNQPDYAAPDLRDGLTQDREWSQRDGVWLNPDTVSPPTPDEEAQYRAAVAAAKSNLAPAMAKQREIYLKKKGKSLEKNGLSPKRARAAAIKLLDNGVLSPADTVLFDDGFEVTVLELLNNGSEYDGKTCKDPVEPDYNDGASVGIFYWNEGRRPSIHSFAHGSKWYAIKHSVESTKATFATGDYETISHAFALTDFGSNTEEVQLEKAAAKALGLGQSVIAFRTDVAEIRKGIYDDSGEKDLDPSSRTTIAEGRWPVDKPLPAEIFPFRNGNAIISHPENYSTMLGAYGIRSSYDVIKKAIQCTGPGIDMSTDNAYLALFSTIKGLAALNGLPHGSQDLNAHLPAIADRVQDNPVRDYLAVLDWDGEDRFKAFAEAMEPHDIVVARIALTVWLIGAAAACEHFEIGIGLNPLARPSFEYVLAILGRQGINKTKGFLGMVPKALAKYVKDGVILNPKDKDSVMIAVRNWLVELGELDATFRQGQIALLKAFLSIEADELRMPYAAAYSKFRRRTAFMGTVNQDKFLKDATGNRRYLVLDCARGFPTWSPDEIDQLWAQAWALYVGGAQWWPTDEDQVLLDANAERFRQRSWFEDELETRYAWGEKPTDRTRVRTTELLRQLGGGQRNSADPKDVAALGNALRRAWLANGAYMDGPQLMVHVGGTPASVRSDGGKAKGWLLPPDRMSGLVTP